MSGVIDKDGQQWEHCCHCGVFIEIEKLVIGYSPKWPKTAWVDLCPTCKSQLKRLEDGPCLSRFIQEVLICS